MLRYLALVALLVPSALAAQPKPRPLVETSYDGIPFAYRSDLRLDGNVEIIGRMLDTRDEFRLVVKPSGRVVGRIGGNLVRFAVAKKVRDGLVENLRAKLASAPAEADSASLLTYPR